MKIRSHWWRAENMDRVLECNRKWKQENKHKLKPRKYVPVSEMTDQEHEAEKARWRANYAKRARRKILERMRQVPPE
jgi:hypothetical protein